MMEKRIISTFYQCTSVPELSVPLTEVKEWNQRWDWLISGRAGQVSSVRPSRPSPLDLRLKAGRSGGG